ELTTGAAFSPGGSWAADEVLFLGVPSLAAGGMAGLFAAPVHLLKEVAHDSNERRRETGKQEQQRHRAPKRTIGRQPRLKAGRQRRHNARDDGEERQGSAR